MPPNWPFSTSRFSGHAAIPADGWDAAAAAGVRNAYRQRFHRTLETVLHHAPPPGRVIDIAGGAGNFSLALAELGYDVVWNDLRSEFIDDIRRKDSTGRIACRPGNALDLDFAPTEHFDVVVATEVIEHVAHPDRFLLHLASLLLPGGRIVLTTPCGNYFRNTLPRFSDCADPSIYEAAQFKPDSDGHIFLLYLDEIHRLARETGLRVVSLETFNNPLTSGHIGLGQVLPAVPPRIVELVERATNRLPLRIAARLHTTMLAVLAGEPR